MNVALTALLGTLAVANAVFLIVTLARRTGSSSSTSALSFSIVLCAVVAAGLADRDVIGWMHYVTVAVFTVLTLGNGIGLLRPATTVEPAPVVDEAADLDEPDLDGLPLDERIRNGL